MKKIKTFTACPPQGRLDIIDDQVNAFLESINDCDAEINLQTVFVPNQGIYFTYSVAYEQKGKPRQ